MLQNLWAWEVLQRMVAEGGVLAHHGAFDALLAGRASGGL